MKHFELQGKKRITGKKADVKSVRREDRVPCVIYGAGVENVSFSVDEKELKGLTHTPYSHIVDLNIEGAQHQAILKAIQYHPVTDRAIHVDFLALDPAKPVTIDVPVKITGNSIGVRQGGKLNVPTRKLKVCGLQKDLPDVLPVDITSLGLDKKIRARDLSYEGITMVTQPDAVVCMVKATRNASAAAAAAAEAAEATE